MKSCSECAGCLILLLILFGLLNVIGFPGLLCLGAIIVALFCIICAIQEARDKKMVNEAKELLFNINKNTTKWPYCPMDATIERKPDRTTIVQVNEAYRQFALLTYVPKENYAIHQVFNFSDLKKWKSHVGKKSVNENGKDIQKINKIAVNLTIFVNGDHLTREICIYDNAEIGIDTDSHYLTHLRNLQSLLSTIKPESK